MAQFTRKSTGFFDSHWRPRIALASKVLQDAQDSWLLSSASFPHELMLSILFWLFRFDFHATGFINYVGTQPRDLYRLTLADWRDHVGTPESECQITLRKLSDSERQTAIAQMRRLLGNAVSNWEDDPMSPSPEDVIFDCVESLGRYRFVRVRN